jgi:hypothetical protein
MVLFVLNVDFCRRMRVSINFHLGQHPSTFPTHFYFPILESVAVHIFTPFLQIEIFFACVNKLPHNTLHLSSLYQPQTLLPPTPTPIPPPTVPGPPTPATIPPTLAPLPPCSMMMMMMMMDDDDDVIDDDG